ncbi:MAG: hypothetical protein ACLTYN_09070 [Dysosmobacter welbionis]
MKQAEAAKTPPGTGRGGCGGIHAALGRTRSPKTTPAADGSGDAGGRLPGRRDDGALLRIRELLKNCWRGERQPGLRRGLEHCAVRPWRAPASISSSTPRPCRTAPWPPIWMPDADRLCGICPEPGGWRTNRTPAAQEGRHGRDLEGRCWRPPPCAPLLQAGFPPCEQRCGPALAILRAGERETTSPMRTGL